ncbi:MAG TPA: methyltransferase domain-containing protein [Solirubrobacterales bacterium]|nr:methyltransferase domain-containing protein [Solirubrobacterales bacterium]
MATDPSDRVPSHDQMVKEEFARQAASFEDHLYSFGDPRVLSWLVGNIPPEDAELVLDVAGGTGHVARAYAEQVRCATVLDLTGEMLAVGKREADRSGVANVIFQRGEADDMPFLDDSFDLVVSRFAVHHFEEPAAVLAEMARVCRPGGRVGIMDLVAAEPQHAEAYNHRERLRDPSHSRALATQELCAVMEAAGLELTHEAERDQPMPLERWLAQSNPPEDVAAQLRDELATELEGGEPTGMRAQRREGELYFTQRWAIVVGRPTGTSSTAQP